MGRSAEDECLRFESPVIEHHTRVRAFVRPLGVDRDRLDEPAQGAWLVACRSAPVLPDGKFAVDVPTDSLRRQDPRVSGSAAGLEREDGYLYTAGFDAGLEVMKVDLLPDPTPSDRGTRP